jgi:hypothetical protein
MQPVLTLARRLDIAANPDPQAIFEAGTGGFQVWCIPTDRPQGWNAIAMQAGAFSKPCEYVGSVIWRWDEERIVALEIQTTAYALADQKPHEYCSLNPVPPGLHRRSIFNREADLAWLTEKVTWLFEEAGVPLLPFVHEPAVTARSESYLLTHYRSAEDGYLVLVSPAHDPEDFCRHGYHLAATLELWNAADFPCDVVLSAESDTEDDEGPLVEQYENAARLHDDDWLESRLEDDLSGWAE